MDSDTGCKHLRQATTRHWSQACKEAKDTRDAAGVLNFWLNRGETQVKNVRTSESEGLNAMSPLTILILFMHPKAGFVCSNCCPGHVVMICYAVRGMAIGVFGNHMILPAVSFIIQHI